MKRKEAYLGALKYYFYSAILEARKNLGRDLTLAEVREIWKGARWMAAHYAFALNTGELVLSLPVW